MAGNTIAVFKSVQRVRSRRFAVFVVAGKVIAVFIDISAVGENSRIERQSFGTKFIKKIYFELHKTDTGRRIVKRVVNSADNSVYKIESEIGIYKLFPVIQRRLSIERISLFIAVRVLFIPQII